MATHHLDDTQPHAFWGNYSGISLVGGKKDLSLCRFLG